LQKLIINTHFKAKKNNEFVILIGNLIPNKDYSNAVAAAQKDSAVEWEINVLQASSGVSQNPTSTSASTSKIDLSSIYIEAAKRFAPIVYMESKEKYFFSSVDFYLQSCKLYDGTKKLMKNGNDGELPSEKK